MTLTIAGRYITATKEIETAHGIKFGGLFVPDENKVVCPNETAEHKLDIIVSKKGNLVAILKK